MTNANTNTVTNTVTKTAKTTARRNRIELDPKARITVLEKENPRREGTGPHRRFAALLRSRTVGDFLRKEPGWQSTITRAIREKLVRVA